MVSNIDSPLISVVTPVYNGAPYLKDYFDSILKQSYSNYEVIMIDDGSEDGSLELAHQIAKQDKRFKVISQKHGGISAALSNGVREAKSEFIVWMDQDDVATSDRLKVTMDAFWQGAELIMCAYELIDAEGKTLGRTITIPDYIRENNILLESLKRNYFLGSALAFRNRGGFCFHPLSGGTTDYDISLKMLFNGYKFYYEPSVLLKYRVHSSNTSANYQAIRKNALDVLGQYELEDLFHSLLFQGYRRFDVSLTLGILALFKEDFYSAYSYLFDALDRVEEYCSDYSRLELFFYLGVYFYNTENYDICLKYLTQALEIGEINASVVNNIGVLKGLEGKYDDANKWFEQAMLLNNNYMDARKNHSYVNSSKGQQFVFTKRLLRPTLLHSDNITGL